MVLQIWFRELIPISSILLNSVLKLFQTQAIGYSLHLGIALPIYVLFFFMSRRLEEKKQYTIFKIPSKENHPNGVDLSLRSDKKASKSSSVVVVVAGGGGSSVHSTASISERMVVNRSLTSKHFSKTISDTAPCAAASTNSTMRGAHASKKPTTSKHASDLYTGVVVSGVPSGRKKE